MYFIPLVIQESVRYCVSFARIFFVLASGLASGNAPHSGQKIWGASLSDSRFLNPSRYNYLRFVLDLTADFFFVF